MNIPFNQVFLTGDEEKYIHQAIKNKKVGAGGEFTAKVVDFLEKRYDFGKCFLTTSCTSALEMAALLIDIQEGDEIILPAYTFVSTANAFALKGAKLVFADSQESHPNIDAAKIEALITDKTKAIVVVHYAGEACDMEKITALCKKHRLFLIEDAAQAIDSFYHYKNGRTQALGSFGDLAAFSFHETKNITCGEGGMLVVNNKNLLERASIVYQKGTNREQFLNKKISKYEWVDLGSSYALSELNAAFLYAQIKRLEEIQRMRKQAWRQYFDFFQKHQSENIKLPKTLEYSIGNAHVFFLLCNDEKTKKSYLKQLNNLGIQATFHFSSLNKSPFFTSKQSQSKTETVNSDKFSHQLIRLPLFNDINTAQINCVLKEF